MKVIGAEVCDFGDLFEIWLFVVVAVEIANDAPDASDASVVMHAIEARGIPRGCPPGSCGDSRSMILSG